MDRHIFKSSNLEAASYDEAKRVMTIGFKSGAVYEVKGFSVDDWQALKDAESPGAHFHRHIKGRFDVRSVDAS